MVVPYLLITTFPNPDLRIRWIYHLGVKWVQKLPRKTKTIPYMLQRKRQEEVQREIERWERERDGGRDRETGRRGITS